MNEWAEVECILAVIGIKTGTYIKRIAAKGEIAFYDMKSQMK